MSAIVSDSAPAGSEPVQRPLAVLVVEDEILIRFAVSDYLRERGLKVYEAGSCAEAIQLLSFYKTEIDVVFSDVKMPGPIDGFDLSAWIEQNRPEVSVILTSGSCYAQARGVGPFFTKPYDLNAIFAGIEAAAAVRRAQ